MTLKIPKLWNFFLPKPEDPEALHDLNLSLDRLYQELYKELEIIDAQQTIDTAAIATNVADIASNDTDIATNVTDIGTNVTDITNLESRIGTVNMKVFSGTTDNDSETIIAHGLTASKILGGFGSLSRADGYYFGHDAGSTLWGAADAHRIFWNGTNIYLNDVGTGLRNRAYRVILFYVD